MSAKNFAACMKIVLTFEGGKVDDPHDPGGRTNQGVIQRVYDGWRKRNNLSKRDVYLMIPSERDAIYRAQYWDVVQGDQLPAGIDIVVFDGAVNSGPTQSVKWLQRALGVTRIDGTIGDVTLAAISNHPDHDALIAAICQRRLAFLQMLKTWSRYKGGWSSRVNQLRKIGQAWATGSVGPAPVHAEGGNVKAPIEHATPLPTKAPADASAGAGVATAGAGGALQTAKESLEPLAGTSNWINYTIATLAIVGALLVIGGIAYRWYASRKAHDAADVLDLPSGVTA